ncbi:MAG: SulP family inorganic anion transporter [Candidatus Eisenbacteria bacterium]|jgi:MFS superfamily sulfate permease-like transporter|nr:SulP family inorganic anion transporter [Candidatus Eisenbacteria bacterium]
MGLRLFNGLRPQCLRGALRNALGGVTQVSMNILQVLGYMRIAGTPVVTGLYTVFLPLVAFAVVGSSRHLVVAADSATTPNFVSGLSGMAATESAHYMDLVAVVALLTAGLLLLARIFRLGFLADSLLCTVLVGLLTGVGVQVGIAMLGGLLGIAVGSPHTVGQFWELLPPQVHLSPLYPAVLVGGLLLSSRSLLPCLPMAFFVLGAFAAGDKRRSSTCRGSGALAATGLSSRWRAGAPDGRGVLARRTCSRIAASCGAARAPLPQAALGPAEAWR